MKSAFIIFDQMTALDMIGAYDPLTRLKSMNILPDFEWDIETNGLSVLGWDLTAPYSSTLHKDLQTL